MANELGSVGSDLPKRRWKDILWAIQAPPDEVAGWMDWATGILYLNSQVEGPEHYETLMNGERTDDVRELLETITHENVHFVQMVTTGYMYRWACRLYDRLVKAMKPLKRELIRYIDNPDPRSLQGIEQQVLDSDRLQLRNHLAQLDRPAQNGISVRDLLESHAFLVEKKSHWRDLNGAGYLQMLNDDAPGPEYRAAYDLARFRLGDGATFAWFPLIVSLCLGAEDPPGAFDVVVGEMATWSLSQDPQEFDSPTIRKIVATVPGMIGPDKETVSVHPLYTPAVLAIQDKCAHGFNMPEFYADPANKIGSIMNDIIRPMVFRANAKDQFAVWVPPEFDRKMVPVLLIYSVLASRMFGADLFEGVDRTRVSGYEWTALMPPELMFLEITPDQLQCCDVEPFNRFVLGETADGLSCEICALWGRCLITFDVDGDAPIWTRDDVRRFIATIQHSNPAFPAFLSMNPEFGMFRVWFGSLADPSAFRNQGRGLDLGHASVMEHLTESIGSIEDTAEALGFQARPLIQSLLTPYPRDFAVQIVDSIFGTQST